MEKYNEIQLTINKIDKQSKNEKSPTLPHLERASSIHYSYSKCVMCGTLELLNSKFEIR